MPSWLLFCFWAWRCVHVSLYSAGRAALQNMLLLLPLAKFPLVVVPGLFVVYSAVKLYDWNVVEGEGIDGESGTGLVSIFFFRWGKLMCGFGK